MQTLDDQLLFKRLLGMNVIEKQAKDAFDQLTGVETLDINEKKRLRSLIEEAIIKFIQITNDQMGFASSKLDQLGELKNSELSDEMKLQAFNYIMDEYKEESLWRRWQRIS
jgi:hypothetical protein